MVAQSFRLPLPRLGLVIATMSYFKAAERTLVFIASTRVAASNREFGSVTLRAAQRNPIPGRFSPNPPHANRVCISAPFGNQYRLGLAGQPVQESPEASRCWSVLLCCGFPAL